MQDQFIQNSKEIQILQQMTMYAQYFTRDFTAVGFFCIRKRIIFSIIEHGTTYLIVAVQFNKR